MKNLTSSVCEYLIGGILQGTFPPGSKILPERELAAKCSVSRITVRRAFTRLEDAGIILRKRPAGTYIADTFRAHSGELKSIGLITTIPNEFCRKFIEAVSRCCEKEDLLLALGIPESNTLEAQWNIAIRMAARGVKNLIVWGIGKKEEMMIFERLRILGVNLVFFDQIIPGTFADYVGLNNETAIRSLFQKACDLGKTNFLFLNYENPSFDTGIERENAFLKCLKNSGLNGEIIQFPDDAAPENQTNMIKKIRSRIKPETAVIAMNSPLLLSIFREPLKKGLLMCVDDTVDLKRLNAIGYAQPISKMAEEAVELLKNQCRNGNQWTPVQKRFHGSLT